MVELLLIPTVNAALDPYRNWTEPRDGVGSNPFRLLVLEKIGQLKRGVPDGAGGSGSLLPSRRR